MVDIPVGNCCGCTACSQICPVDAIQMQYDREGFFYPKVNNVKCISCKKCEKVCPVNCPPIVPDKLTSCVIAQNKDEHILMESTSGGFMDALNRFVVDKYGGKAVGVAFNDHYLPEHRIVSSVDEIAVFHNSKYAQSNMGNIFRQIRHLLDAGTWIVFTGTPCQVAGLKAFLGKDYERLIAADLVCRSIPSPLLWRQYLDWQENRTNSSIREVACRRKTYGYHHGALEILFENGTKYAGSNRIDYFMKAFHGNIASRPSCYSCPFKTVHRCSDFTVFDCGHPEEAALEPMIDDDRGFSGILVHTCKGKMILDQLHDVRLIPADKERLLRHTGGMEQKSIVRPTERDSFYFDLETIGFHETMRKYVKVSWKDLALERIKPVWYWLWKRKNRKF